MISPGMSRKVGVRRRTRATRTSALGRAYLTWSLTTWWDGARQPQTTDEKLAVNSVEDQLSVVAWVCPQLLHELCLLPREKRGKIFNVVIVRSSYVTSSYVTVATSPNNEVVSVPKLFVNGQIQFNLSLKTWLHYLEHSVYTDTVAQPRCDSRVSCFHIGLKQQKACEKHLTPTRKGSGYGGVQSSTALVSHTILLTNNIKKQHQIICHQLFPRIKFIILF